MNAMRCFRHLFFVAAMISLTMSAAALMGLGQAHAARPNGYPITNVNLRAGPGTDYPVILTVPSRAPISIRGCLPDTTWCEVIFEQNRGWMAAMYLAGWSGGKYYLLRDYAPELRYPTISFEVGNYWDTHYRNRPFYGERERWRRPRGEGWTNKAVFYKRLAPYGRWVWLKGQYVWVPTRVDSEWRPYTRGRWVYTDQYGWMWASDEPWGWATYHYGRWGYSNRVGWFWVPGNRWAPAWVSWRSSGDYLAWAPLPPEHDGGVSINVSIGAVPDYYWSVVPAGAFLSVNLSDVIVRDRNRVRPVIANAKPLGNVKIEKNVVVNKVVNVKYIEEKTKKKVVARKVARTKDAKKAGKVKGDEVEVFEPTDEPETAAPPEPKKIEEVAAESKTKEQAGGEPGTEELLVPPEVKEATKDEAAPPAPPPPVTPKEVEAAPVAPAEEATPPKPPAAEAQPEAPPTPAKEAPPAKAKDSEPAAPKKPEQAEPVEPSPALPAEEAPPPATETAPPPPAPEEAAPEPPAPEKSAPAPEPKEAEPKEAEPKPDGGPKAKKGEGKGKVDRPMKQPAVEQEADQPPAPPAKDIAPPAPAVEDVAPAAPPPLPAEQMGPPKAKRDGKPKKDKPQRAQPADQPPAEAADAPPPKGKKGKKGPKPAQDGSPCPEGSLTLDDGSCVPAE